MELLQEIFKKLFYNNEEIIVADTETSGLSKIINEEITSPEITQFAGIKYNLQKDLEITEEKNSLLINFNGYSKRYFNNYKKIDNKYILDNGDTIEIINNIPILIKQHKKSLLFTDSLKLEEITHYNETYRIKDNLDFQASAVTKIVNSEELLKLDDVKLSEFILINFNTIKNKIDNKLLERWKEIINNNQENLSTFISTFLREFKYLDISKKNEKGVYIYNSLDKEKIYNFLNQKIVAGHNFAQFDYMNVLKGNEINPKIFIIDTMFFQKEVTKGNSLDINIIYYLEQELKKIKLKIIKNNDLVDKVNKILTQLKTGRVSLNNDILNFDDYDQSDNSLLNKQIKETKEIIKLINDRRFAHDALLDVKLNKFVLDKKLNNYFNKHINEIEIITETKTKLKTKELVEPIGIIGVETKDTKENLTTFQNIEDYIETTGFKNIVITDESPKNYYKLNNLLSKKEVKNNLSFLLRYKKSKIKVIINDKKGLMLLSLMTSKFGNLVITDEHISDLIEASDCQVIFPIETINESKKFKSDKIKIGINLLKLPKQKILENQYVKEKGIFIAGNKYGGENKIVRDIIWHGVQQNEKIDQSLLVNFLHSDIIDLKEESLDKLTKEYLTTIYSAFPEIGKNSNNLLNELKNKEYIKPVIFDEKNIFFTPKKLGLTDKEFKNSDEFKKWSLNHTKENITFTKSIAPYISILQTYIKQKNKELFISSPTEHKQLMKHKKNREIYKKLLIDYNPNNVKTIKDKFELIQYLIKNDSAFKPFLEEGLNKYNDRVIFELKGIFDMKGKGISNGNNFYTTRMLIKTMDDLLIKKELKSIDKKFDFISKEENKFFDEDYNKTISTILNAEDKELETLEDNILIEQEKRTVGPARGSAGGSLYAYLMGITNIEPMKYNLLFERFLNPERASNPDMDNDFPFSDNKKGLTIEKFLNIIEQQNKFSIEEFSYLFKDVDLDKKYFIKYFKDYRMVKKLGTESETTPKNLFRKLLSVLKVPPLKVNEYSATYNEDLTIKENIQNFPDLYNTYCLIKDIEIDVLNELPMNVGSAASAVMLNYIGLVDNKNVMSFTKNSDAIFDDKLDVLSLATIKQIGLMQKIIRNNGDNLFNYNLDDLNDKETLYTIQKGETGVIFQMESALMTNYLKDLFPLDYQAMADTTAIQRPGPLEWAAQPYLINRRLYYKQYFTKLINLKYGDININEKIMKEFYNNNINNPYISFLTKKGERKFMLNFEQFKVIMNTKPFLETPEFTKIAGLHIQNLLTTDIAKIRTPEDLDIIIDEYKEKNGDLNSVESIYIKHLEIELIDFLNNNDIAPETNIFRTIHKISLSKTVNQLRNFENTLSSHKIFKEITDKTYNTLVYQEDIMQLVQKAGGFTLGAADILRRAISKKKYDLSTVKPQIIDNLSNQIVNLTTDKYQFTKDKDNNLVFIDSNKEYKLGDTYIKEEKGKFSIVFTTNKIYLENIPKEIVKKLKNIKNIDKELGKISNIEKIQNFSPIEATYLYDKMKSFAGYAFNKSHADAYTNITYMTAYLKTHYSNIFYNTILRIGNEKNAQTLLRELNVYNKELIIPTIKDINLDNTKDIIFPISKIKSVNADIELAINYVKKQMNVTNMVDIYRNLGKKYLNKTTLNNLCKFGFFNDMFSNLQEKQLSNNIEIVIKALNRIEKDNKNYLIDLITDKLEEKEIKLNKTQIKSMITKYLDYKKETFIYNVEEERNKYYEFNVLEISEVEKEKLDFIKDFENDYPKLTNDYWRNQGVFKIDKDDFNTYFIDLISETEIEKNKDKELTKIENDEKIKEEIDKLNENISNDNYYDNMEKQLLYVDMLKEYNYLKNVVRVIEVKPDIVNKEIKEFQRDFKLLYNKKKKDSDGITNHMSFNTPWIGKNPLSLILIPNYVRSLNVKKFNGNVTLTPKIKINGKYTFFENRKLEKEKQYFTNQGRKVEQKAIQRLYVDDKYIDFVAQKNGIFFIGEKDETFINIDSNNKYKGIPLEKNKIADAYGNIVNKQLAEELGIEKLDLIHEEFNNIHEDLIKNDIDLNTVVIISSSAKIDKEKINWFNDNNYLKLLSKFINNCNFKSIIPMGTEALKTLKSLNNINFMGFKTDFNYPYQYSEKLGYAIVTFVENRFVPNYDTKLEVKNKYYKTLKAVLKDDIVIITDSNGDKFQKIHNVKKNKTFDRNIK